MTKKIYKIIRYNSKGKFCPYQEEKKKYYFKKL